VQPVHLTRFHIVHRDDKYGLDVARDERRCPGFSVWERLKSGLGDALRADRAGQVDQTDLTIGAVSAFTVIEEDAAYHGRQDQCENQDHGN